ncbi:DUF485 domain-containing protein [Corynebacterium alimapuense]|uniref:DUF485 domain-containing protein n=1 Tax=Corynebacterium alimapuense TaxID=1576874 RepID=A0A3M8K863_9CORY|nr:DUF485 domain-containing protein [Corynebacterium alimapuense]
MQASPEFKELRSTYRSFTFPMSAAFFVWFLVYVFAAVFFPEWMGTEIGGGFNIGILFGFLQFVTTFAITWIYVVYANKYIEPRAAAIRQAMEG